MCLRRSSKRVERMHEQTRRATLHCRYKHKYTNTSFLTNTLTRASLSTQIFLSKSLNALASLLHSNWTDSTITLHVVTYHTEDNTFYHPDTREQQHFSSNTLWFYMHKMQNSRNSNYRQRLLYDKTTERKSLKTY